MTTQSKRVKVITFHAVLNYGAVMQAYSLCKTLSNLGCSVELIDYRPGKKKSKTGQDAAPREHQESIFETYLRNHLSLTECTYETANSLGAIDADVLICGSDQIWNLGKGKSREAIKAYFLDFGSSAVKRIAYAASTGGTPIPEEYREYVREQLARFEHISVREPGSIDDLRDVTEKPVSVVLDPTLLCNKFPQIDAPARSEIPPKYIAVFCLQKSPAFYDALKHVRRRTGLPIVSVGLDDFPLADLCLRDLNPAEWLSVLKQAEFVVTNSFHGTVFSIKLEKTFISVPLVTKRPKRKCRLEEIIHKVGLSGLVSCLGRENTQAWLMDHYSPKNQRIENILGDIGLSDRLYRYPSTVDALLTPIDYSQVNSALAKRVGESMVFLSAALSD